MRVMILLGLLAVYGCQKSDDHNSSPELAIPGNTSQAGESSAAQPVLPKPSPPAPFEPVFVMVKQRSTVDLPKLDEKLRLTVDDITAGQVITSLSRKDGAVIHAPVSLRVNDLLTFPHEGRTMEIKLTQLHNALVGEDFAQFELAARQSGPGDGKLPTPPAKPPVLSEREKISRLIEAVAQQPEAVFVRNGREYSGTDAAEHLRRKWSSAGDRVQTADEFIEQLATRSSLSGEAYAIRFPDGSEQPSAEFLREQLRRLQTPSDE